VRRALRERAHGLHVLTPFVSVAEVEDDAAHLRVVQMVRGKDVDLYLTAVGSADMEGHREVPHGTHRLCQRDGPSRALQLVRVEPAIGGCTDRLGRRQPEQLLDPGAGVAKDSIQADHDRHGLGAIEDAA